MNTASTVRHYRVTFDRLGRNTNPDPLYVRVSNDKDSSELARAIHTYARPFLMSRDFEVTVDLSAMGGWITAGSHQVSWFTLLDRADNGGQAPANPIMAVVNSNTDDKVILHREIRKLVARAFKAGYQVAMDQEGYLGTSIAIDALGLTTRDILSGG